MRETLSVELWLEPPPPPLQPANRPAATKTVSGRIRNRAMLVLLVVCEVVVDLEINTGRLRFGCMDLT
jgi:hypothetical protein